MKILVRERFGLKSKRKQIGMCEATMNEHNPFLTSVDLELNVFAFRAPFPNYQTSRRMHRGNVTCNKVVPDSQTLIVCVPVTHGIP